MRHNALRPKRDVNEVTPAPHKTLKNRKAGRISRLGTLNPGIRRSSRPGRGMRMSASPNGEPVIFKKGPQARTPNTTATVSKVSFHRLLTRDVQSAATKSTTIVIPGKKPPEPPPTFPPSSKFHKARTLDPLTRLTRWSE